MRETHALLGEKVFYEETKKPGARKNSWLPGFLISKFILALGVEELPGAVVIRLRHEDLGGAAQIAVIRPSRVRERLRGGDAVLFQHRHKHLGVDHRAGVKQFHTENLTTDGRG